MASFEDYNKITSIQYASIKSKCLEEGGAEVWNLKKQEWKDALIRHGNELQAPDRENAEIVAYMNKVITQQEDLVRRRLCYLGLY